MPLTRHQLVSYTPIGHLKVSHLSVQASEDVPMTDVYRAIADPTRRQLIRLLAGVDELPLHEIAANFQVGRTAVSKHLTVLQKAGLVAARKVGRETRYHLNAAPLREVQEWASFYEALWTQRIVRLRDVLEEEKE